MSFRILALLCYKTLSPRGIQAKFLGHDSFIEWKYSWRTYTRQASDKASTHPQNPKRAEIGI